MCWSPRDRNKPWRLTHDGRSSLYDSEWSVAKSWAPKMFWIHQETAAKRLTAIPWGCRDFQDSHFRRRSRAHDKQNSESNGQDTNQSTQGIPQCRKTKINWLNKLNVGPDRCVLGVAKCSSHTLREEEHRWYSKRLANQSWKSSLHLTKWNGNAKEEIWESALWKHKIKTHKTKTWREVGEAGSHRFERARTSWQRFKRARIWNFVK